MPLYYHSICGIKWSQNDDQIKSFMGNISGTIYRQTEVVIATGLLQDSMRRLPCQVFHLNLKVHSSLSLMNLYTV